MSRGLTFDDLVPKRLPSQALTASARLRGLLTLNYKPSNQRELFRRLEEGIADANVAIIADLRTALADAMSSVSWPRADGSRSDIIDTGELLSSGRVTATRDGITIAYDAPYAALVYFGGYVNPYGDSSRRVYLPPRPWVDAVLSGGYGVAPFDFASYYERYITAAFNR